MTHEIASILDVLPTVASLAGAQLPKVILDGVDMTELLINGGQVGASRAPVELSSTVCVSALQVLSFSPFSKSKRETMMFYPIDPTEKYGLFAIRLRKYKAHFYTKGAAGFPAKVFHLSAGRIPSLPDSDSLGVSGASHSSTTPDKECSLLTPLQAHDPPLLFDLDEDPPEHYPLSLKGRADLSAVLEEIEKIKRQFEAGMVFGESQVSRGDDPDLRPCCNPDCSPKPECCHCATAQFFHAQSKVGQVLL